MLVKNPSYRKNLSSSQYKLLEIICEFRFVTIPLLSAWTKKDKSTFHERLRILEDQKYIRKQYDPSYKLQGKAATYSLTSKGIGALRKSPANFEELVYRNQYKNKTANDALINHNVDIFKQCLRIKEQYSNRIGMLLTKSRMTSYEYFMRPLSDMYVTIRDELNTVNIGYFQIEIVRSDIAPWMIRKRLKAYQDYYYEKEIRDRSILLFICDTPSMEKSIRLIDRKSLFTFSILTTTRARFISDKTNIWLHVDERIVNDDKKLVSLYDIKQRAKTMTDIKTV